MSIASLNASIGGLVNAMPPSPASPQQPPERTGTQQGTASLSRAHRGRTDWPPSENPPANGAHRQAGGTPDILPRLAVSFYMFSHAVANFPCHSSY